MVENRDLIWPGGPQNQFFLKKFIFFVTLTTKYVQFRLQNHSFLDTGLHTCCLYQDKTRFFVIFLGLEKTRVQAGNLPYVLAPTPRAGDEPRFEALYVPSGKALWAAVEEATPNDQATSAPLIGVQGGFY